MATRDLLDKLDELVTQFRRIAYAAEAHVLEPAFKKYNSCTECGCRLVPVDAARCPVCGAQIGTPETETNDGHDR